MKTKNPKTQGAKILSLLLAVTLAFVSLPQIALPVSSSEAEPPRAVLISAEYEPGRGEYEKHFLLNDGSFIAVSYADAVHYEDVDGKWVEADNRLSFDENTSRIVSESGDFGTSFASPSGDGDFVSVSWKDKTLSWSLSVSDGETEYTSAPYVSPEYSEKGKDKDFSGLDINDPETFELDKAYGFISYPSLFEELPEISANYSVSQNRVEEDVYINSPTSAKSFSMNLTAEGFSAVINEDNSVSLVDSEGVSQFNIGSPYMEDAKGETLYDITVSVYNENGQIKVTYTPDEEWLSDESRAYPILLDPSVTTKEYASNIVDTYVREGSTSNYSSNQTYYYGVRSNKIDRAYIRINNLPKIDASMPVISASMRLYFVSGTTTGKDAQICKATESWNPSTITFANQPYSATATVVDTVPFQTGSLLFNLSSDFYSLYDEFAACENYGYVLKYADESKVNNPDYNRVCSVETPAAGTKMPYVTVNYGYSLPNELSSGTIYELQNVASMSYMTVHNGTNSDGANIYQQLVQPFSSVSTMHKFKLEQIPSTGGYYLRAMCSSNGAGKVVDIVKTGNYIQSGNNVQLKAAGDAISQQWLIIGLGYLNFKIVPRVDMSLALTAYGTSDGTSSGTTSTSAGNIFVSNYEENDSQKWLIRDESGTYKSGDAQTSSDYYIAFTDDGMMIKGSSSGTLSKASYAESDNTIKWIFVATGDGTYTVRWKCNPDKCLTVKSDLSVDVETFNNGNTNQKWEMVISSSGNMLRSESTVIGISGRYLKCEEGLFEVVSSTYEAAKLGFIKVSYLVPCDSISISDVSINVGDSRFIYPTFSPYNATCTSTTWTTYSSDNTTNCSFSSVNKLTGNHWGTATITARNKITGRYGSATAYVTQLPAADVQNKQNWCWAAAAKQVVVHNRGTWISEGYTQLTNIADIDGIYMSRCGYTYSGSRTADAVQRAIVVYIQGNDSKGDGTDTSHIASALSYAASGNNIDTGAHGTDLTTISVNDIDYLNSELSNGNWVVGGIYVAPNIHGYTGGHSIVIKSYNSTTEIYSCWDPDTGNNFTFSYDNIANKTITVPGQPFQDYYWYLGGFAHCH